MTSRWFCHPTHQRPGLALAALLCSLAGALRAAAEETNGVPDKSQYNLFNPTPKALMREMSADRPDKTVGSFWPDLSTVFDYIKRAMPFGNAQSLSNDEIYALTAYILTMNDIVKDENFELNEKNFTSIKMPNAEAFYDDDRETAEKHFWNKAPCMNECRGAPKVTGRAMSIDVTPDSKAGPRVE